MIEIRNLTKSYGDHNAVKGISFTLEDGKIYGFLGVNGAGKSTTMNMLAGCLPLSGGDIIVDGISIHKNPYEIKKRIGYLPETPPLYTEMTVYEYLRFVSDARGVRGNAEAIRVTEAVSVTDVKDRLIRNLSKGYKQRVGIAGALIGDPKYIILDEPTVGLDPTQIIDIRELIISLKKDHTVILSSHILSEVSAICDEILIISNGELIEPGIADNSSFVIELEIKTDSVQSVTSLLNSLDSVTAVSAVKETENGFLFEVSATDDIREKLFDVFCIQKAPILEMHLKRNTLEDIFIQSLSKTYDEGVTDDAVDL